MPAPLPDAGSVTLGDVELPAFDVTADSFSFGNLDLGALTLKAVQNGPQWELQRLDLKSPEGLMSANGTWQLERGQPQTRMKVSLDLQDIGGWMRRLHLPEGVKGGTAKLDGTLAWRGNPYALDYASLSGQLTLDVRKGQFTRVDPGIGKLLGVVSLQSLPRRVSLDFRDVFSQGFAFDEIKGGITVTDGVMRTSDLLMVGPAARVAMKGSVDLGRETQDLDVRVAPSISDSVAVGTALLNPAVGLATFLVGRVLDNPIDNMISFEYKISGSWSDPQVAKVQQRAVGPVNGRQ
ncbi:MAG: hypothetical protein KIT73_09125 [Burkholderiales bacterium]|nr:hypothetical protein [Burkholderiales bacterium]